MGLSPFRRVIHLPVNTNIMTRDIFFEGGSAALRTDTGTGDSPLLRTRGPVQFADEALDFVRVVAS